MCVRLRRCLDSGPLDLVAQLLCVLAARFQFCLDDLAAAVRTNLDDAPRFIEVSANLMSSTDDPRLLFTSPVRPLMLDGEASQGPTADMLFARRWHSHRARGRDRSCTGGRASGPLCVCPRSRSDPLQDHPQLDALRERFGPGHRRPRPPGVTNAMTTAKARRDLDLLPLGDAALTVWKCRVTGLELMDGSGVCSSASDWHSEDLGAKRTENLKCAHTISRKFVDLGPKYSRLLCTAFDRRRARDPIRFLSGTSVGNDILTQSNTTHDSQNIADIAAGVDGDFWVLDKCRRPQLCQ